MPSDYLGIFVVQLLRRVQFFAIPWTAACQASLSFTLSQSLLKLMSVELVMPSNHLILCHPLLLLPSFFPITRVFFQWVSSSHQVAKVLALQLQHQSFQWIFRVDFLQDWLVWSPCNPRNSQKFSPTPHFKKSVLWCSAFFTVQLSHLFMTTGKTMALTIPTFISKVMSLPFNMLSRFVIAFLPRGKHLLISWLQSPSAVILEPKKIKSSLFPLFSLLFVMKWWDQMTWS